MSGLMAMRRLPVGRDLSERRQVGQQRLTVGAERSARARRRLNSGTRVLSPSLTLSPTMTVSFLPPGSDAHVDAALAQRLEERQRSSRSPRLAERDRGRLLHRRRRRAATSAMCLRDLGGGRAGALRHCRGGEPRQQRERERAAISTRAWLHAFFWYVPWCLTQSQPLSGLVYWLHGSAFTRPLERETTLNWPSLRISPISTGL